MLFLPLKETEVQDVKQLGRGLWWDGGRIMIPTQTVWLQHLSYFLYTGLGTKERKPWNLYLNHFWIYSQLSNPIHELSQEFS